MRTVFGDTYYFLALLNPADQAHAKAVAFTRGNAFRILTTDWVLTELADGLARSPIGQVQFLGTFGDLHADTDATIIRFDQTLMAQGIELYAERNDKQWSLTDCISFIVMNSNGITEALTGDHHFEQAGFTALLK